VTVALTSNNIQKQTTADVAKKTIVLS